MIAASVKDAESIVDLLLSRGADANEKSQFLPGYFALRPCLIGDY